MQNKTSKKTDFSITILLVVGIVAVVNFFAYQIFHRFDLTANKMYSISDTSKNTMRGLDDVVNIKAYFSKNLPAQWLNLQQEAIDILNEYEANSRGKVKFTIVNPEDTEEVQRELYMIGIPQLTFDTREKDKMQIVKGYLGVAISFGGKSEAIPMLKSDISDLEYQVTTAMKKVTNQSVGTIGYLTSNGTKNKEEETSVLMKELAKLYNVVDVDLESKESKIENVDTLLIIGPTKNFSDEQVKKISEFLDKGGAVFATVDGVKVETKGLTATKNEIAINKIFEKYGIKLNNDLVADSRSGVVPFTQGFMQFQVQYPLWPLVNNDGFNKDQSAVSKIEQVLFPWVSSLDKSSSANKFNVVDLVKSSKRSWLVKDNFNLNPNSVDKPSGELSQRTIAMISDGALPQEFLNPVDGKDKKDSGFKGKLAVVGDSDFVIDQMTESGQNDSLVFAQNIIDSLSLDGDLINIRSKNITNRPISDTLSDAQKAAMKYGNVFGVMVLVLIFGMTRYFFRRRSSFVDQL